MTIIISNCSPQHCNLISQTIIQKSEELNTIPKIITHNLDQKVIIEENQGIADITVYSDGIDVEIIAHNNDNNA